MPLVLMLTRPHANLFFFFHKASFFFSSFFPCCQSLNNARLMRHMFRKHRMQMQNGYASEGYLRTQTALFDCITFYDTSFTAVSSSSRCRNYIVYGQRIFGTIHLLP
ncbi:hypothetical protein BD289DRAFT_81316 [Coniella lustricola]|uniref:Uncharacterized protein n=1 Tax=Coniella lustricola TaxID=2025994 RepID=A0A2T3AH56_9PEZI|nr:hypothetical protein BD289DRAFT_81316 [Coniella lustricola]